MTDDPKNRRYPESVQTFRRACTVVLVIVIGGAIAGLHHFHYEKGGMAIWGCLLRVGYRRSVVQTGLTVCQMTLTAGLLLWFIELSGDALGVLPGGSWFSMRCFGGFILVFVGTQTRSKRRKQLDGKATGVTGNPFRH